MKITTLPAVELTPDLIARWGCWQRADPTLASAFFRPEFTQAVASVRSDVEVAVLEEEGEVAGFFPFQRGRWGIARPVGGRLCDFHGLVAKPGLAWDAEELIRGCGLRGWEFDHVPTSQRGFLPYGYATAHSPFLDLTDGFELYRKQKAGSDLVQRGLRLGRKLAREVGPLQLDVQSSDPQVFAKLLQWKSAQYRRTRVTDVFSFRWVVQLLERLVRQRHEPFAGWLLALRAGEQLAAVQLMLRSHEVVHDWFSAYNRSLAHYSPGVVLSVEFARIAQRLGICHVDMGRGMTQFKRGMMTGVTELAEGCVAFDRTTRISRLGWHRARAWVRSSALGIPARLVARWTRPVRGWLAFR
jgi:CelD/BcsL family acetyltransferase involved in cellulose biosynthesis